MTEEPTSAPDEALEPAVPSASGPTRRRASRPAGPTAAAPEVTVVSSPTAAVRDSAAPSSWAANAPATREPNRHLVTLVAGIVAVVLVLIMGGLSTWMYVKQSDDDKAIARRQQFVAVGEQTVVNMYSYTPNTIDASVKRFVDGISGPLADTMSPQMTTLAEIYRSTNATSEAVVKASALEAIDEDRNNASVLVAMRVTLTDLDGVNKPTQDYRLRVIVHEDDNGRMTGYDLKYPEGGN